MGLEEVKMQISVAKKITQLLFILLYAQIPYTLGQSPARPQEQQYDSRPSSVDPVDFTNLPPDDELHMGTGDRSEITRCTSQVSNTFFNQGIRLAVASMKTRLAEGIPEYGVPPMEPLLMEGMSLDIAKFPAVISVSLLNLKVWDLSTFTKNNWFLDVNTRILDMSLTVPSFLVTGEYILHPMMEHPGNISIKFDDVVIKSKTKMKIIDTSRYPRATPIKADKAIIEIKYDKVRIRMSDLFPEKGYEDLNYAFRVFTERHSELLYEELKPVVLAGTEKVIVGITDAVLNSAVFHRRLPSNGILPGLNLSTLTNWYDRVRNALQVQLPSVLTRSNSYRSLISILEAAFKSCRSYTDVTDTLTQPFINLLGLIGN